MIPVKLIKIKLPIKENDKRINNKTQYLAKIEGVWYAGFFAKEWYGWFFDAVYDAGYQIDYNGWDELYQIKEKEK